ncbi:MAG: isoprenylcysteine carboxylmethyltransferase family protein [Candidatus Omnitrophota bacterium]|nr:isoprenylcysteine carboxylmethyltransferase family protein [Candidatus Omnitrophota bacterium]
MKKRIKIQGLSIFISIVITVFLHKWLFPQWKRQLFNELFNFLGVVLVLFGFLFRVCARGHKEEKSSQGRSLVKDGPYALIRNPMYFGTLLIGIGTIAILFQFWTIFLFLAVFLLIYIPQVRKEEALLSAIFKEEYREYSKAVPGYFPHIRSLLNLRKHLDLKLSWVKKELSSFIFTMIVISAIEIWEDTWLFGLLELIKKPLELVLVILFLVLLLFLFRQKKLK